MRVDAMLGIDPQDAPARAGRLEAQGFDAAWCGETAHDPFVTVAMAANGTRRIQLGTGVAIAFARSPMTLAMLGNDLQTVTRGRFFLGLGSQVRAHVERRYGVGWSRPVARMRELVLAIRHIWSSWATGSKPAFEGEFSTHTLMPPVFDPGPNLHGNPPIFLAAVGERMAAVAGEVADGLLLHSFVTERYVREVADTAVRAGAQRAGRDRRDIEVSYPAFVMTGSTEAELVRAAAAVRQQVAFYGSTPSYLPVLALHGWDDLHSELHALSKRGDWDAMTALVDDEVLSAFAVAGPPTTAAKQLASRFGDIVDRVTVYMPYDVQVDCVDELVAELRMLAPSTDQPARGAP
jgi:probable F420-dependent oxidoreductase